MSGNEPDSAQSLVDHAFNHLLGLPVWDPKIGHGSFFTIQFGDPRVNDYDHTQGDFHLWVFGAQWELREGATVIAHCENDRATMDAGARLLDGVPMRNFDFDRARMTLSLQFGQYELAVPPLGDPEMEEWLLFLDDGNVITAGPGVIVDLSSGTSVERPQYYS